MTSELVERYLQTALDWAAASDSARKANRVFDLNHRLSKQLRETEAGRAAIAALMHHPVAAVRLLAASDSLASYEAEAVAVLEALMREPGLLAVSAEHTLKAYREGTLDLDW